MMLESVERSIRLKAFLAVAAGKPFVHGKLDCALLPADWCLAESGIDPAASVRGKYDNEAEWKTLADADGGLPDLWKRLGEECGLVETDKPEAGDIGLVSLPGHGIFGAIKGFDDRWLVLVDRGLIGGNFEMLSAWSVPCRKQ